MPGADDVTYDCSCPDDGEPCKHAAALVYVLAERLDDEPATALTLRGVELSDLLRRIEAAASGPSAAVEDLTASAAVFHRARGPLPEIAAPAPLPGRTVADDLDDGVLGPGAAGVADTLRPAYAALVRRSRRGRSRDDEGPAGPGV
nr:SWIM zinc finger family protein [Kineococcus siccus]